MAKDDKAKVKITVISFETESDNETLKENIRVIAQTLSRALTPQVQRVSALPVQAGLAPGVTEHSEEIEDFQREDYEPTTNDNLLKKKPAPRKSRARTPQPVELDLVDGNPNLKQFLTDANPQSDIKRYLAIAFWLRKYRNIEEVTADHAYTCYRHMGWQVPGDPAQPFRAMKGRQYGWMKAGTKAGAYAINHLGENEVEKMRNGEERSSGVN